VNDVANNIIAFGSIISLCNIFVTLFRNNKRRCQCYILYLSSGKSCARYNCFTHSDSWLEYFARVC